MDEFCIGIEFEGLWKAEKGVKLPSTTADHQGFARTLVPIYNKLTGGDMLRAIFDADSHPGRLPNPKNQWTVVIDPAIGGGGGVSDDDDGDDVNEVGVLSPVFRGRTYSTTFCGVTIP